MKKLIKIRVDETKFKDLWNSKCTAIVVVPDFIRVADSISFESSKDSDILVLPVIKMHVWKVDGPRGIHEISELNLGADADHLVRNCGFKSVDVIYFK